MDCTALYKEFSIPLQRVENLVYGEDYFDLEGNKVRFKGNGIFEMINPTPLISGEKLPDLKNENVLKLFWTLSRKKSIYYETDSD